MAPLIDYALLEKRFTADRAAYAAAQPFPHIVIDDFLQPGVVNALLGAFPKIESKSPAHGSYGSIDGEPAQFRKKWVAMELKTPPLMRQLYRELMSADFLSLLEHLSGITGLLTDPHLMGGGIHETCRGGFLKVHADFNVHPEFHFYRRMNLLIYLNKDWQPEWHGDLEIWDSEGTACIKKIAPLAGRAVIFSTSSCSFHGHPTPLACPEGNSRKSIALYYYHQDPAPHGGQEAMHMTLWRKS